MNMENKIRIICEYVFTSIVSLISGIVTIAWMYISLYIMGLYYPELDIQISKVFFWILLIGVCGYSFLLKYRELRRVK